MQGNNLRRILKLYDVTVAQLADHLNMSHYDVWEMVDRRIFVPGEIKLQIVRALIQITGHYINTYKVFPAQKSDERDDSLSIYFDLESIDAKTAAESIRLLSTLFGKELLIETVLKRPPPTYTYSSAKTGSGAA